MIPLEREFQTGPVERNHALETDYLEEDSDKGIQKQLLEIMDGSF